MKAFIAPNVTGPTEAISIDENLCIGCNACANICRIQTILPNPVPGKPPLSVFPDECWYCGSCVEVCRTGALTMHFPINSRVFFKRKATGKVYRIGTKEEPEKTYFEEPIGWK